MVAFTHSNKSRHAFATSAVNSHSISRNIATMMLQLSFAFIVATCVLVQTANAKNVDNSALSGGLRAGDDGVDSQQLHHHHQHQHQHHQQNAQLHDQAQLHHQHNRRSNRLHRRDSHSKDSITGDCEAVKSYFETIDIRLTGEHNTKGAICGGNCCSNATETELREKATTEFERLLHHHTKSLRGILESTASLFQSHVLELAEQSENKTLNVFSQVYRRMVPLSRKLIHQLYTEIMSHLKNPDSYGNSNSNSNNNNNNNNNNINSNSNNNNNNNNLNSLEDAIHKFFVNLFPVAYHQAVHLSKDNYGELHEDYINCLKHTFDDLQPFGTIPKDIKHNLIQSVQTAQIFMSSLLQSGEVLTETDELYGMYLTDTCKKQLLKMSYCPSCNGVLKSQVKTCYSYCMNVLRGCSAQYAGVLDSPWSNVVDAIDNLVTSHIRSDTGIVTTIKQLDGKLSETIMRAMENGPELEKKVKKTCGTPKLLPSLAMEGETRPMQTHNLKWATPPDAEILRFLSTIDKSKEFYSNIVNNVCDDEDVMRSDHNCWTGDRIGDYSQLVMTTGVDTQRYNPEVPLESNAQTTKLNELVDKLLKIRKNIGGAIPSTVRSYSDIQADMGHQEEEGSGRISEDDEEYGQHGSGDGSGDGATPSSYEPIVPTTISKNDVESRSKAPALNASPLCLSTLVASAALAVTLVTNHLSRHRRSCSS